MKKLIYPLSLITLGVAMFLIIKFPDSGRMNLIGGGLITIGLFLNIIGYVSVKGRQTKV